MPEGASAVKFRNGPARAQGFVAIAGISAQFANLL